MKQAIIPLLLLALAVSGNAYGRHHCYDTKGNHFRFVQAVRDYIDEPTFEAVATTYIPTAEGKQSGAVLRYRIKTGVGSYYYDTARADVVLKDCSDFTILYYSHKEHK